MTTRQPRHLVRAGLTTLSFALLTACTVGPNFVAPQAQVPEKWTPHTSATTQSHPVDASIDPKWWSQFGDAQLDALIQRAVSSNLDIQVAATRLLQSRWERRIVGAAGLPSVGANAAYQRTGVSGVGVLGQEGESSGPADGGNASVMGAEAGAPFNLYQYGFDAAWELDLWGRNRRANESADAMIVATDEMRHGVIVSVLTETATSYIQLRAVQATTATVTESLTLAKQSLELTKRRRAEGVATTLEVSEASALVASIESELPALEEQQGHLVNALSLLVAQPPGTLTAELAGARPVPPVPAQVPVGLPSELARRRPDIRQAEARLHSSTANIGVAQADFYPHVTLSGNIGMQSLSFASLGTWAARQFAVGPTMSLPIFEGGRLKGTLKLREAQQQEAALAYQKTVLNAWREIDDALIAYDAQQRRRASLTAAVEHSQTAYRAAVSRYKAGASTFLDVLVVQRSLLDAQTALVHSNAEVSLTVVRLYKALGGGWEDSPLA